MQLCTVHHDNAPHGSHDHDGIVQMLQTETAFSTLPPLSWSCTTTAVPLTSVEVEGSRPIAFISALRLVAFALYVLHHFKFWFRFQALIFLNIGFSF
jgi:hypothetical protein